jgi:peptidoglycan/xylan/chitin deacetylase (PgdA/CDA1 family)
MQFRMQVSHIVDLCPSAKPLDRNLFTDLINNFGNEEKPVPIAVSITGIWMERHQSDLDWLKFLVDKKEISITWINHSYNHNTSKNLPLKENFLLAKGTDLNYEVLETEIKMIKEGLHPSVFFRFPGLVSDKIIFKRINDFGLIPIGSDAWLGKNQWPKNGSIILLHANGNEPIGIERFLNLLNEQKNNIRNNQWLLYDLRESVEKFEDSLKLDKSYK